MMEHFLVRFSQSHETFRVAELQALATLEGLELEIVTYNPESPFCVIRVTNDAAAKALVRRSLLVQSVHSLWGIGATLSDLHDDVSRRAAPLWPDYISSSFKLEIDSFQGRRTAAARLHIIDSFAKTLPLVGPIDLHEPKCLLTVFERWTHDAMQKRLTEPEEYFMGRFIAHSSREAIRTFDLKKRRYIATTSMDAELSLLTANLALAAPGKLFYDPFVGTGSFPLAAAYWGAVTWGSDIDGRAVRGSAAGINGAGGLKGSREGRSDVRGNFEQYGLLAGFGDVLIADLTNTPLRRNGGSGRWIDGIVCDPPYGVREGPRVLGCRNPTKTPWVVETGRLRYKEPTFLVPKQPYSFTALLHDLLQFAADTLVDNGRLSFWMPIVNDEIQELHLPTHPCLVMVSVCMQVFNKWSRRLITYRRIPDGEICAAISAASPAPVASPKSTGLTANELNPFRRSYFAKFVSPDGAPSSGGRESGTASYTQPTYRGDSAGADTTQLSQWCWCEGASCM